MVVILDTLLNLASSPFASFLLLYSVIHNGRYEMAFWNFESQPLFFVMVILFDNFDTFGQLNHFTW